MRFRFDKILIATNNSSKIKEISEVIVGHNISKVVLTPRDFGGIIPTPAETALDFEENAKIKALEFYNWAQVPVISDDSGLEVDSLYGRPGIHSARYAGENATDEQNRHKLLTELEGIENRIARFKCVMCIYDGLDFMFGEGVCNGSISLVEAGENGFGYDPIFIPNGYKNTFGELPQNIKYVLSHRSLALNDLAQKLINQDC